MQLVFCEAVANTGQPTIQVRWQQQQQQQQQQQPAGTPAQKAYSARGLENIEVFTGGEAKWKNWLCEARTAASGFCSDSTEVVKVAEAHQGHGVQKILEDDADLVEAHQMKCTR